VDRIKMKESRFKKVFSPLLLEEALL